MTPESRTSTLLNWLPDSVFRVLCETACPGRCGYIEGEFRTVKASERMFRAGPRPKAPLGFYWLKP
jgi:hypothetical protein